MEKTYYDDTFNASGSMFQLYGTARVPCPPVYVRKRKYANYVPKENWRTLISRHENATTKRTVTSMDFETIKSFNIAHSGLTYGIRQQFDISGLPYNYNVIGDFCVNPLVHNSADLDSTRAFATTKFLQAINDRSVAVSGGVIVGELAETLRMLRSPMESLKHGYQTYIDAVHYKAIKAKVGGLNKKHKHDILNDIVVNTWLEANLGWLPLFSDISGIIEAVRDLQLRNDITQVSTLWSSTTDNGSIRSTYSVNDIGVNYQANFSTKTTVYSKCGLLPEFSDIAGAFGLKYYQFVPTIYNLIPYTFVFDYFSNLNSLLSAAVTVRDQITYSSISTVQETKRELFITKDPNGDNPYVNEMVDIPSAYVPGHYRWTLKDTNRSDIIPSLQLAYKVPRIKQILTVAALLSSSERTSYKLRGL